LGCRFGLLDNSFSFLRREVRHFIRSEQYERFLTKAWFSTTQRGILKAFR
jgi:hypothetical protein